MTFADLKALTRSWLDDPSGGYFTDAVIHPFINNAQKEVQKHLLMAGSNWYMICKQTTLIINQALYRLPSDFRQSHRLELIKSGTFPNETKSVIAPITFNQQDYSSSQTGDPDYYVIKKNAFNLFPTPDSALVMRLNYSYMVADMVLDSDVPDVPDQYQEFIAVLAAIDGALKDKTDMTGILAKKGYYEAMLKSDASLRTADQPRSIVVTEDGGFGGMF